MNKNVRFLFASWLVVACSAGSPTPCLADTAVLLKPDSEITRYAVKLSDLFQGVPPEIDRDIAQAPPACHPAVYNDVVLNKLADTYRLDWQPAPNADHVTLSSPCTRITSDRLRDAIIAKIKDSGDTRGRNFDVAFDTHNMEIDLPGDQQNDFKLENFSYDPTARQFRTDFSAETPRGSYNMPITGRVSIKRSVPILSHRLEGGTTISANDLDWIQVPEERLTPDVVTEADQLVGHELRRDTAEGDLLRAHDIIPPRLVLRGSLVTMRIQTPFITVTTQGKAQQDGAQGEVVRILNTDSNRIVEGTVTGPGMVEIHTAQRLAAAE